MWTAVLRPACSQMGTNLIRSMGLSRREMGSSNPFNSQELASNSAIQCSQQTLTRPRRKSWSSPVAAPFSYKSKWKWNRLTTRPMKRKTTKERTVYPYRSSASSWVSRGSTPQCPKSRNWKCIARFKTSNACPSLRLSSIGGRASSARRRRDLISATRLRARSTLWLRQMATICKSKLSSRQSAGSIRLICGRKRSRSRSRRACRLSLRSRSKNVIRRIWIKLGIKNQRARSDLVKSGRSQWSSHPLASSIRTTNSKSFRFQIRINHRFPMAQQIVSLPIPTIVLTHEPRCHHHLAKHSPPQWPQTKTKATPAVIWTSYPPPTWSSGDFLSFLRRQRSMTEKSSSWCKHLGAFQSPVTKPWPATETHLRLQWSKRQGQQFGTMSAKLKKNKLKKKAYHKLIEN